MSIFMRGLVQVEKLESTTSKAGHNMVAVTMNVTEPVEFIELYNSGPGAVSLAGWQFTDAVEFTFPNGTSLAAGGYPSVIERDFQPLAALDQQLFHRLGGGDRVELQVAHEHAVGADLRWLAYQPYFTAKLLPVAIRDFSALLRVMHQRGKAHVCAQKQQLEIQLEHALESRAGVEGGASFNDSPRSSNIARTLPYTAPAINVSPILSVPFCTSTVATGPRPRSSFASKTTPEAERRAFNGTGMARLRAGSSWPVPFLSYCCHHCGSARADGDRSEDNGDDDGTWWLSGTLAGLSNH
jgi:hypothetical protein